ncbi:MAG: helix-turn-helix transcriptional regulator [Thermomicrobiales bacterium]
METKTLREWRVERLWSQKSLATQADIRQATVAALERGVLPQYETINKVSIALGVKPFQVSEFAEAIAIRSSRQRPRSKSTVGEVNDT